MTISEMEYADNEMRRYEIEALYKKLIVPFVCMPSDVVLNMCSKCVNPESLTTGASMLDRPSSKGFEFWKDVHMSERPCQNDPRKPPGFLGKRP